MFEFMIPWILQYAHFNTHQSLIIEHMYLNFNHQHQFYTMHFLYTVFDVQAIFRRDVAVHANVSNEDSR